MRYQFLVDTYASECMKVVSVWSEFKDEDFPVRPRPADPRGRSVHLRRERRRENRLIVGSRRRRPFRLDARDLAQQM
jgi:hypothetical protein